MVELFFYSFRKNNVYYCSDNIKHCGADNTYYFCPLKK